MNQITPLLKACVPAAAILALAAGCAAEKDEDGGRAADAFLGKDEVSSVTRIADRQIAAGARTDGTLRPYHFRHDSLNSLGEEKLDLMLSDDEGNGGALVVYFDAPYAEAEAAKALDAARRESVAEYLMSLGLGADSFRLESGYNPNVTTSVVQSGSAAADAAPAEAGASQSFAGGISGAASTKK